MEPVIFEFKQETFYIRQFLTQCLGQMTYYIESEGQAAIIDPMRDHYRYLDLLKQRNAQLKYIFETHIHADFVSSHIELNQITGAPIVYGPTAQLGYQAQIAEDNQIFDLGKIQIKAIHTPGHTNESTCYLLLNEKGEQYSVFTGDTLFLGDVGRPDLCSGVDSSKETQAEKLYYSLTNKVKSLSPNNIVFPAHGAGSSCGKNMSDKTNDTLQNQLRTNWALQDSLTVDQFVASVTNISLPPKYYFYDAKINKLGYTSKLDEIVERSNVSISAKDVNELLKNKEYVLVDCRKNSEFMKEFIPNSISLSLDMPFAQWIGSLISPTQHIIILAPENQEKIAILRLARIGYENVKGYLQGGLQAWKQEGYVTKNGKNITAGDLIERIQKDNSIQILDVRKPFELETAGSIKSSLNIELANLETELQRSAESIPNNQNPLYVICRTGVRSVVAISILEKYGYFNTVNVLGGFVDVSKYDVPQVIKGNCPSNQIVFVDFSGKNDESKKVRITLALKKIQFTEKSKNDSGLNQTHFNEAVLLYQNKQIIGSSQIIEFLEEEFPHNKNLLPKENIQRAQVRGLCQVINTTVTPFLNQDVTQFIENQYKQSSNEWINNWMNKGFETVEKMLKESKKRYCFGDEITQADIYLFTQVQRAVEEFQFDLSSYHNVQEVYKNLLQVQEFQQI